MVRCHAHWVLPAVRGTREERPRIYGDGDEEIISDKWKGSRSYSRFRRRLQCCGNCHMPAEPLPGGQMDLTLNIKETEERQKPPDTVYDPDAR